MHLAPPPNLPTTSTQPHQHPYQNHDDDNQAEAPTGTVPDSEKQKQELRPLQAIGDSRRKIVITADPIKTWINPEGITIMSLPDFLLTDML